MCEIGESSHVSIGSETYSHKKHYCQSVFQKRPRWQSFKVYAGFFCLHAWMLQQVLLVWIIFLWSCCPH